jgi:hypothetical protein
MSREGARCPPLGRFPDSIIPHSCYTNFSISVVVPCFSLIVPELHFPYLMLRLLRGTKVSLVGDAENLGVSAVI